MTKLKVKLRQHTPIIHFQTNQNGATLRATELKPKLDKFIKSDLKIICDRLYSEYNDLIEKYFLSKDDAVISSSYKLRISSKKESYNLLKYQTAYFGNNRSIWLKDIELEFFSFNERIIEFIKKILPYYFICNNFGQRQSKGFGCFSVDKWRYNKQEKWISYGFGIEQVKECLKRKYNIMFIKQIGININTPREFWHRFRESLEESLGIKLFRLVEIRGYIKFWFSMPENKTIDKLLELKVSDIIDMIEIKNDNVNNQIIINFRDKVKSKLKKEICEKSVRIFLIIDPAMRIINEDYQILKSGKTHKESIKSKLLEYMYEKNIRWEKKGIKENLKEKNPSLYNELKGNNNRYNCKNADSQNYRYVRAMLGLAENNEYQTTRSSENKLVISIKDKEEKVDRFQSPLTFRVFDTTIFILPEEIPEEMYNKTFNFSLLKKNKSNKCIKEVDSNFMELSTPISKEEFNLKEFLQEKLPDLEYEEVGDTND